MSTETRIVLIKPGDVLIIGNVGPLTGEVREDLTAALATFTHRLDMPNICVFEQDISVDVATDVRLADLEQQREAVLDHLNEVAEMHQEPSPGAIRKILRESGEAK